jgi:hypothetical protein
MFSIRSADLHGMSAEELERQAEALAASASSEEAGAWLDSRIRQYELRYEMSSAEMSKKLAAGEMKETAEIARWLVLWSASRGNTRARR